MPPRNKAAHHRGQHDRIARTLNKAAHANPNTLCWRCHNTLATCGPNHNGTHQNGTPATWHAGHTPTGYQHECSPCNTTDGATKGNRQRTNPHTETW
jgi:hypothetical protein